MRLCLLLLCAVLLAGCAGGSSSAKGDGKQYCWCKASKAPLACMSTSVCNTKGGECQASCTAEQAPRSQR